MIGSLRTLSRKVLRRNKRSSVHCSLAKAFLKVKSNVNGANFGLVSFLGIVILVEKIYVI